MSLLLKCDKPSHRPDANEDCASSGFTENEAVPRVMWQASRDGLEHEPLKDPTVGEYRDSPRRLRHQQD
jgi:hypothetical protein